MAQSPLSRAFLRPSCQSRYLPQIFSNLIQGRSLSTTIPRPVETEGPNSDTLASNLRIRRRQRSASDDSGQLDATSLLRKYRFPGTAQSTEVRTASPRKPAYPVDGRIQNFVEQAKNTIDSSFGATVADPNHHLHVYSHRHNCHITLTGPDRNILLSASAGKLGFKHSQRGSYDAAYQLAVYTLTKMVEKGIIHNIEGVELVLRGFGAGREAVVKAIVGSEGRRLKPLIVRVTDSTRLKFGGTKSKNVRRL